MFATMVMKKRPAASYYKKTVRDKYMTRTELLALIRCTAERNHKNAFRDRILLILASHVGLRVSEALALKISDFYFDSDFKGCSFNKIPLKKRKNKIQVDKPISEYVGRLVKKYVNTLTANQTYLFVNEKTLKPISRYRAEKIFKYYARKAGLNPKYSFHSLRHTCGFLLLKQYNDISLVMERLDHSYISSTEVYRHMDPERERQATNADDVFTENSLAKHD